MKKINISTPKYPNVFTSVDDNDYEWLNQWKWHPNQSKNGSKLYVKRFIHLGFRENGSPIHKTVFMHKLINETPDDMDTDHINQNPLDNRRKNLRTATRSQNQHNVGLRKDNKSGIRGVNWNSLENKWKVFLNFEKKHYYLGTFRDKKDAIMARKEAERIYVN